MKPLNPKLYAALQRVFGAVKISNQGVPMSAVYTHGRDGKKRLTPISKGEYYAVVCDRCHDTKGHLYFNHRWGVRDPVNGTRNLWLATCFLCGYPGDWDARRELAERLGEYNLQARFGAVSVPDVAQAPRLTRWNLPADFELLSELTNKHRAVKYVRGRGFRPDELASLWGVGFSMDAYRHSLGRIVIPLRAPVEAVDSDDDDEKHVWILAGYQGRSLDENEEPKYLTTEGTAKSRLLYGLDHVPEDTDTPIIVCEGPTDVWRAGPGAVALLGKTISTEQSKLLRKFCPGREVVVMLDPEAVDEGTVVAERLQAVLARDLNTAGRHGRVVVAKLPDDRDPGDCSRDEIQKAVGRALRRKTGS